MSADVVPVEEDDLASVPSHLVEALASRGITERKARQLVSALSPEQNVLRQIEWGDFVIARAASGTFWNPAGFYVALVRDNLEPPDYFLSSEQRAQRDEAHRAYVEEAASRRRLNDAYREYREQEATRHIAALDAAERDGLIAAEGRDLRQRFPSMHWTPESLHSVAEAALRTRLASELQLPGFTQFVSTLEAIQGPDRDSEQEEACAMHAS